MEDKLIKISIVLVLYALYRIVSYFWTKEKNKLKNAIMITPDRLDKIDSKIKANKERESDERHQQKTE